MDEKPSIVSLSGFFAILHICRIGSRHTGGTTNKLLDRHRLKYLIERHKACSVRPDYVAVNKPFLSY